ncbi:MAG: hypothetical protein KJ052_18590, partial [Candidatus Hydrogenedentes bacterium]|nr:hypothetical protein [Candidatus Hydrogenedentota bacterium]
MHQQRDRKKGRAWKEIATDVTHGAVFTYEAISSGQSFGGIMVLPDDGDALLKRIQEAMPPAILLGRSRSSRYGGLADISWGNPQNREHQFGPSLVTEDISKEQVFRVLLTSDYAGRDNLTGQPDPAALVSELLHALQGKAAVVEGVHGQRVRLGHTVAGGFNRKWGLELPHRHTVRMGSVIVLRARDAISLT